ncbi:MAG: 1-phosphofructokinase family hexose kinase [Limnochordia bacterium]|jgi:1-phosphofructokinase|nr:1-phosphofructokinase family hexose kinase [Bacillota bacterium]
MHRIITITLNPALDMHYYLPHLEVEVENYSSEYTVNAGGKGVNVSRALAASGVPSLAVIVAGRTNYQEFAALLDRDHGEYCLIPCEGAIRRNITIHHDEGKETRISQDGFPVSLDVLEQVQKKAAEWITPGSILVFSGRVPKGVPIPEINGFLRSLKELGALLVIDSNSFSLTDLIELEPWLIKPNEHEIELLLGRKIKGAAEAEKAAGEIKAAGIENVLISLGAEGMVFAGSGCSYRLQVPAITPVSTIGAGDSTIAGFIAGYTQGASLNEALKTAASFGTAACLTEGTNPPLPNTIAQMKEEIRMEKC